MGKVRVSGDMNSFSARRWPWIVAGAGLIALLAAGAYGSRYLGTSGGDRPAPSPSRPPASAHVAEQVHSFCGTACHGYPKPESFPRRHWQKEVERGFRFFEVSGRSLKPPRLEDVVRYYEERAPEELPELEFPPPAHPLEVRFEPISYHGPAVSEKFAISNVNLVHLPPPGKETPSGKGPQPLDILACDMRNGLVMLLRPYEQAP